jgi:hypothetical protein
VESCSLSDTRRTVQEHRGSVWMALAQDEQWILGRRQLSRELRLEAVREAESGRARRGAGAGHPRRHAAEVAAVVRHRGPAQRGAPKNATALFAGDSRRDSPSSQTHPSEHAIATMYRVLALSMAGYDAWGKPPRAPSGQRARRRTWMTYSSATNLINDDDGADAGTSELAPHSRGRESWPKITGAYHCRDQQSANRHWQRRI